MTDAKPDNRVGQVQVIPFRQTHEGWQVLLLKRNKAKGGFWQAVTGGIEPDETPEAAGAREIEEELNLSEKDCIRWENDGYTFTFTDTHKDEERTFTEHVLAVVVEPTANIELSSEHTEMRWLGLVEAMALLKYDSNKDSLQHYWPIVTEQ